MAFLTDFYCVVLGLTCQVLLFRPKADGGMKQDSSVWRDDLGEQRKGESRYRNRHACILLRTFPRTPDKATALPDLPIEVRLVLCASTVLSVVHYVWIQLTLQLASMPLAYNC